MEKILKNPVNKFLLWVSMGIVVCLIGITNVFADEITFKVYDYQVYYDNNGSSVSQVGQTFNYSFNAYVSNNITTSANSYGAGVVINSGIPIISGHAYSISFYFIEKGNIALSSKNRIALGSSVSGAASSYTGGSYYATMITSKVVNGSTLQFAFTANASYQYIFIPWTTTSTTTQNYVFDSYLINDLGASSSLSQSDINNSLNSQTNTLNQSITNSQNAITSNADNNRDLIIQNQNENTISQIIADGNNARQQEVNNCTNAYMFNLKSGYTINPSNTLVTTDGAFYTEDYITINNDVTQLTIKNGSHDVGYYILVYDTNKSILDYWYSDNRTMTLPSGSKYFRIVTKNANIMVYDGNKGCNNKLDEAETTRKGILGKIGDLISYINPTSPNFFVYKLIDLLKQALQYLFVPSNDYFSNWYADFRTYIELKLGFLSTPITIFLDFINMFLNLSEEDIIINIPDIYVPNFEEHKIISATTFNWSDLLESKQSLNNLWNLYLDFIDVFMILNFLGLCEVTYARIFGGDTTQYEYYTTEVSYDVDNSTGEVKNTRYNERKTRREKV